MKEDKFLMLNLEDDGSKKLANVISSDTSREILKLLTDHAMSESNIAEKLKFPLNTVHYNIQQLLKVNLIEAKDFVWSEKGKKINYYQLAKKLIIIAPKNSDSFLNKIKEIFPVFILGSFISLAIYIYQIYASKTSVVDENAGAVLMLGETASSSKPLISNNFNYASWFYFGFVVFLIIYLIYNYFKNK